MPQTPLPPKLEHATDDFIGELLPGWMRRANVRQLIALRDAYDAYLTSQAQVSAVFDRLLPVDVFARHQLVDAFHRKTSLLIHFDEAIWREQRRRFKVGIGTLPTDESYFVTVPALQRLMQNFASGESFYSETALVYPAIPDSDVSERIISDDAASIVSICRSTDAGARYQEHLAQVFTPAFEQVFARDLQLALALQVEIASARRSLPPVLLQLMRDIAAGRKASHPQYRTVRHGPLQLLGCTVHGMVAVEFGGSWAERDSGPLSISKVSGVILVVPDDAHHAIRHFVSWQPANVELVGMFKNPATRAHLEQRVALHERAEFLTTLAKRLADTEPDLEPAVLPVAGGQFEGLALQRLERIRQDARFLLVPTADADARQASERLALLQSAGLTLLNLAGLFVPAVGTLLLANLVKETLGEVFEGARHWTLGHQHEALEHMLGVAETLVVNAAIAGGAKLVNRGFSRSAFVDRLEPVSDDSNRQRLWASDMVPYQDSKPPYRLRELANGLRTDGLHHWWRHEARYWWVRAYSEHGPWRLLDPSDAAAFGPALEWNGESAWRLSSEHPLEWQGANELLKRLWPAAFALGDERMAQVLKVADVSEEQLRGLLVENRPMPVGLRDTLERFAAAGRVERFFTSLGTDNELWQWCLDDLGLQTLTWDEQLAHIGARAASLRPRLLDHLADRYLTVDPQQWLLQRDFSGLPTAYALHVLQHVTVGQRMIMRAQARLPLAVAQQVREQLQVARLTRLREGLYLADSYRPGVDELVFSLLREHAGWPAAVELELRDGSTDGRLLARLPAPEHSVAPLVMVRREGRYCLFDATGAELPASAAGQLQLPEALLACLPETDRQRLGWHGTDAASLLRSSLQRWLPQERATLLKLLGISDVGIPHNPMRRLPDGRVGYLLSGRTVGFNTAQRQLRSRIRSLYPGFNEQEVETFLNILLEQPGSAFRSLVQQEQQYQRLSEALTQWVDNTRNPESQAARVLAAREMRRSWRLIGERIVDQHGESQGLRLSLAGAPLRSLPELPVGTNFDHVAELILSDLSIERIPAGFLRCFSQVRWLNLSGNTLTEVPSELGHLRHLRNLSLAGNHIRMTAAGVAILRNLTHLRFLDLNYNPSGTIGLELGSLARLRELRLRGANLQTVPAQLHRCRLLEVVDLRDNQIGALPQTLLDAPLEWRQAVRLSGNPLSEAVRQRMQGMAVEEAVVRPAPLTIEVARDRWLALAGAAQRGASAERWDAVRAEPGSDDFFTLLAELTGIRDYRVIPADLGRRVWAMLEAAQGDTLLRETLFNLAADSRSCVDSVASCFSNLELQVYLQQSLRQSEPATAQLALLRLARRLFRLEQVLRLARADVQARLAQGRDADEVEVSLAYRVGLAAELELPGQPRTMQFETIAGVSRQQLAAVAATVREAEGTDQLVHFVAQRDFWLEYLRREQPAAFSAVETPFWERMEGLSEATGSEGAYLAQVDSLAAERKEAVEALVLRLTREAMGLPAGSGSRVEQASR